MEVEVDQAHGRVHLQRAVGGHLYVAGVEMQLEVGGAAAGDDPRADGQQSQPDVCLVCPVA